MDRVDDGPLDTHTLAVREDTPGRLYSAAGDGIFAARGGYLESPDGGDTWERHPGGLAHHYLWGLAVDPQDPNTVLVSASSSPMQAHSAGAAETTGYRREDGGPWQEVRDGLPDTEGTIASVLGAAEPGVFYALNNHGLYLSRDAGKTGSAWRCRGRSAISGSIHRRSSFPRRKRMCRCGTNRCAVARG